MVHHYGKALFRCFALISTLATACLGQTKTVQIEFDSDEGKKETVGEVVRELPGGRMLLNTPDGRLWHLEPDEIISQADSDVPMVPLTSEQIFAQFKGTLPPGFDLHKTKHYVMIHNTNPAYAKWVGELFEQLYRGFYNYWKSQRVRLAEPRFPLIALVFDSKASYLQYAQRDIGDSAKAMIGYYNLNTNLMVSFDMTGSDGMLPSGRNANRIRTNQVIAQIKSQPRAERTVATIVHEAVHQIAYNSGLQVRLADNPRWLSEGLAMYFESPDFGSSSGWSIGKMNYYNLRGFAGYMRTRKPGSIVSLIADDARLLDGKTAQFAYNESWALTYFLMKTKKREFAAYMKELATLRPLDESTPRERIDMFKNFFGDDLAKLDAKFIQYMATLMR